MPIQPVLLCGGQGLRLWPLSRKNLPKQFLKIFNNKSLFQITLERVSKIKDTKNPIIVTAKSYEHIIKKEIENLSIKATILLEPEIKNTSASIYLSAKYSENTDTLLLIPSDHIIQNDKSFLEKIDFGNKNIGNSWLVFGIKPYYPSTNYGYIQITQQNNTQLKTQETLYEVLSFIEKPELDVAKNIYHKSSYFWNSGIFMATKKVILESVKKSNKLISKSCDLAYQNLIYDKEDLTLNFDKNLFDMIPAMSIDYGVLEKIKNIKCIKLDVNWSDVGTFDTALPFLENDDDQNKVEINGKNITYKQKNKILATVGVNDLIIVDTKDALLITKKNSSEDLKKVVNIISEKKSKFINNTNSNISPWGTFEVLLESLSLKVKKLKIDKNKRISYQYHTKRSEHWLIVEGTATVKLNGKIFHLNKGESIDINRFDHHFIGNFTNKELIIIEIQLGDYFGEDDIIRIDDPYDR